MYTLPFHIFYIPVLCSAMFVHCLLINQHTIRSMYATGQSQATGYTSNCATPLASCGPLYVVSLGLEVGGTEEFCVVSFTRDSC